MATATPLMSGVNQPPHQPPLQKIRHPLPEGLRRRLLDLACANPAHGGIVLDTHQILEFGFWASPEGLAMRERAVASGLPLYTSLAAIEELYDVLSRPHFYGEASERRLALIEDWLRIATVVLDPPPACPVICQDPDDQKWLELAYAYQASVILTEDKRLLKAGRRLKKTGTIAITRAAWLTSVNP